MVFQGYLDESEADDTGWFVLAGYVASAEQWAAFAKEWEAALSLVPPDQTGQRLFKHKRMKRHPEKLAVFHAAINRHVEMSVACIVNRRDIEAAIARVNIPHVEGMDWSSFGNPYYVTFRFFMDMFHQLQRANSSLVPIREPVDFYFDESANKKQIKAGWETYMGSRELSLREWFGGDPKFERDDEFMPLQAADFNAGTMRLWLNEYGLEAVKSGDRKYPFTLLSGRLIQHLILSISEDDMVKAFVRLANEGLPDALSATDAQKITPDRIDPPSPVERGVSVVIGFARKLLGR